MSFNTGLSGVHAANKDLQVTGNNIANASTTGFKASRAEFGDAYTASILGTGGNVIGAGVRLENVGQKFTQGALVQTGSVLDMAIDGEGFFITKYDNGATTFTRSGIFGVDREGYIVTNQGAYIQGYGVDAVASAAPVCAWPTARPFVTVLKPSEASTFAPAGTLTVALTS